MCCWWISYGYSVVWKGNLLVISNGVPTYNEIHRRTCVKFLAGSYLFGIPLLEQRSREMALLAVQNPADK